MKTPDESIATESCRLQPALPPLLDPEEVVRQVQAEQSRESILQMYNEFY